MKKIAVFTEHYEIFYELTAELKRSVRTGPREERSGASSSKKQKHLFDYLAPGSMIPADVRVIITTSQERALLPPAGEGKPDEPSSRSLTQNVDHSEPGTERLFEEHIGKWTVLTLPDPYDRKDVQLILRRALSLHEGKRLYRSLIIGIDPGDTPGVAVYGDHILLYSCAVRVPEDCAGVVEKIIRMFPSKGKLIRIGHGDSVIRNRIINTLLRLETALEVVDETGTTHLSNKDSDIDAAKRIAFSAGGFSVRRNMEIEPTEGYLADIQKKSRKLSQGQFTIDHALAEKVARGSVSLEDAVKMKETEKKKKKGDVTSQG